MEPALSWSVTDSVASVPAEDWDALVDPNDPFLEHGFLAALEQSGSVGPRTGWQTRFVLARADERLVGAVPLYLKHDSYGEFIFDWGWASGAHRAGVRYYPKMVAAVPFTPVTGPRLLLHPEAAASAGERERVRAALLAGVRQAADEGRASSVHVLFCTEEEAAHLGAAGYLPRLSMQFHWTNRGAEAGGPYRDFEDFLGDFRSRHRKQVRKERAVAAAHGLRLAVVEGPALGPREWRALELFYQSNADKHGATTYLTPDFFTLLREKLAHRVVATLAYRGEMPVAGALNFERGRHLYGRYWGCLEEREMLHFELCYYALIERAITRGYARFEAGAQGEHKLKRGLLPSLTHSAHWIRHPDLERAIARFVESEAHMVRHQVAEYMELSPMKRSAEPDEGK
jgi:uncharacterized protein